MPALLTNKKAAARRQRVWELRAGGLTFREIGERIGVGKTRAQQLFARADREHRTARKQYRLKL